MANKRCGLGYCDGSISRDKAKNIEWALSSIHMLPDKRFNEDDIVELGSARFRLANSTKSIRSVIADFDYDYALDTGQACSCSVIWLP